MLLTFAGLAQRPDVLRVDQFGNLLGIVTHIVWRRQQGVGAGVIRGDAARCYLGSLYVRAPRKIAQQEATIPL